MTLLLGAGLPASAQKWEFGALGGGGFYNTASVKSPAGDGDVGFKNSFAAGAFLGSNLYTFVGGELRYEYLPGDLRVKSGGNEATFSGEAHAIHRTAHADELERIENPRPNERLWDVSENQ